MARPRMSWPSTEQHLLWTTAGTSVPGMGCGQIWGPAPVPASKDLLNHLLILLLVACFESHLRVVQDAAGVHDVGRSAVGVALSHNQSHVRRERETSPQAPESVHGPFPGLDAGGMKPETLVEGAHRSLMDELASWTAAADKVLVF